MDIGSLLLMLGLAYGFGVLWYDLLPGRLSDRVWRVAAYPFLGIWVAQALLTPHFANDPEFGGIHLVSAIIGSIVAVIVDWIITTARQPSAVQMPELRREVPAAA
jgi:predicted MFS family arabinose efflux permease